LAYGLENIQDSVSTVTLHSHEVRLPEGMTEEAALAIYDNYDVHHRYDNNLPITRYRQDVSQSVVSVIIFCGYLSLCLFIHLSPQGAILCVYAVPRCLLVCHSALLCQNRLQLRSH